MVSKREQRDALIDFINSCPVRQADIDAYLISIGEPPLKQGVRLRDLVLRPALSISKLAAQIPALAEFIDTHIEPLRRDEIIECAEILLKYQGYIDRERLNADKLRRLDSLRLKGKIKYAEIKALSTEARQKLERIDPETIGQASRIPGISPADINILLLLLGR